MYEHALILYWSAVWRGFKLLYYLLNAYIYCLLVYYFCLMIRASVFEKPVKLIMFFYLCSALNLSK